MTTIKSIAGVAVKVWIVSEGQKGLNCKWEQMLGMLVTMPKLDHGLFTVGLRTRSQEEGMSVDGGWGAAAARAQ